MTIQFFIHSIAKRAEAIALIDLGATENFMNLTYAKWLCLLIKKMSTFRKLFNVDGMENKSGELQHYVDLQTRTGAHTTSLRFFLSDLGEHKAILGYPWFAAVQPKIDWKQGWIDHTQLLIILRADRQCQESHLCSMEQKYSTIDPTEPILHWERYNPPKQTRNTPNQPTPERICTTQKGVQ
jgi:hypothetical protein